MADSDLPAWFETRNVSTVYEGFSTVRVETVAMPDGELATREVVDHYDAVAIVAIDDDDNVLLVRQYRQPLRAYILELPAGKLDVPGEDPTEAAQRELHEEAHRQASTWKHLTSFYNSAGWSTEQTHVYLATGLTVVPPPSGLHPKAEEADMELIAMPFSEALARAQNGDLADAKTAVGLLVAQRHLS